MLQALGLQHILSELGFEGCVLRPEPVPPENLKLMLPVFGNLQQRIVDTHKLLNYRALSRKYRNSNAFIRKNIPISYCGSYDTLKREPPEADAFISGSDQVWQPHRMDPFFFLEFVPKQVRRISYAASMGVPVVPTEKVEEFRRYLSGFSYISVRETDSQPVVEALTNKQVHRHIDPVFFLEADRWRNYGRPYHTISKPYILVYAIYWDRDLNTKLKQLHRETGMDVVAITSSLRRIYANKRIYDADPGQFLWLIDHANMVVTSSFHGVAMSILFEKPFSAVIDPGKPSRISCLLDVLGTQNLTIEQLVKSEYQNYELVRQRIEEERERGKHYLSEVLAGL